MLRFGLFVVVIILIICQVARSQYDTIYLKDEVVEIGNFDFSTDGRSIFNHTGDTSFKVESVDSASIRGKFYRRIYIDYGKLSEYFLGEKIFDGEVNLFRVSTTILSDHETEIGFVIYLLERNEMYSPISRTNPKIFLEEFFEIRSNFKSLSYKDNDLIKFVVYYHEQSGKQFIEPELISIERAEIFFNIARGIIRHDIGSQVLKAETIIDYANTISIGVLFATNKNWDPFIEFGYDQYSGEGPFSLFGQYTDIDYRTGYIGFDIQRLSMMAGLRYSLIDRVVDVATWIAGGVGQNVKYEPDNTLYGATKPHGGLGFFEVGAEQKFEFQKYNPAYHYQLGLESKSDLSSRVALGVRMYLSGFIFRQFAFSGGSHAGRGFHLSGSFRYLL